MNNQEILTYAPKSANHIGHTFGNEQNAEYMTNTIKILSK